MLTPVPPTDCMLARESASVRLDGELTELEVARLDAHLRVCADCRAYSLEIGEITNRLQAAKLEQPGQALVLPRRRRLAGARMQAVLAAAAVVVVAATAAASSFTIGHSLRTRTVPLRATSTRSTGASMQQDIRQEHVLALSTRFEAPTLHAGTIYAV